MRGVAHLAESTVHWLPSDDMYIDIQLLLLVITIIYVCVCIYIYIYTYYTYILLLLCFEGHAAISNSRGPSSMNLSLASESASELCRLSRDTRPCPIHGRSPNPARGRNHASAGSKRVSLIL